MILNTLEWSRNQLNCIVIYFTTDLKISLILSITQNIIRSYPHRLSISLNVWTILSRCQKIKCFSHKKNTKNNRKYHDVKLSDHHKIIFQFIGIVAFSFYFIRLFGSFRAQEIPMCVQVRHGKHLLYHCIAANGINLLIQGKHSGG